MGWGTPAARPTCWITQIAHCGFAFLVSILSIFNSEFVYMDGKKGRKVTYRVLIWEFD